MTEKIRKKFRISGRELEFEAQLFGERLNNLSIVVGSEEELKPNHVAFIFAFMFLEICDDCDIDFDDVFDSVLKQRNEISEKLN